MRKSNLAGLTWLSVQMGAEVESRRLFRAPSCVGGRSIAEPCFQAGRTDCLPYLGPKTTSEIRCALEFSSEAGRGTLYQKLQFRADSLVYGDNHAGGLAGFNWVGPGARRCALWSPNRTWPRSRPWFTIESVTAFASTISTIRRSRLQSARPFTSRTIGSCKATAAISPRSSIA